MLTSNVDLLSININCLSDRKIKSVLEDWKIQFGDFPHVLHVQEPKVLVPLVIPGYSCFHNLQGSQHGVVTYVASTWSSKVVLTEHNFAVIEVCNGAQRLFVVNIYNPHSSKLAWRSRFADVFRFLSRTGDKCIISGDINFSPGEAEFDEFCFACLGPDDSSISQDSTKTCRGATRPDFVFSLRLQGSAVVGPALRGSDHLPLFVRCALPSREVTSEQPHFYCTLRSDADICQMWNSLDLESLSSKAVCASSFFLSFELAVCSYLAAGGFLKRSPSRSECVNAFIRSSTEAVVNAPLDRGQKLRAISNLVSAGSAAYSFDEIASALGKAESLHLETCLQKRISRSRPSKYPLIFPVKELREIIDSLDPKKSSGPSSLSIRFLKKIPVKDLEIISNWLCFASQFGYPQSFRLAKVFGVSKADGSPRPICVGSCLAKLYDCALLARISPILTPQLPRSQCAYLQGRRGCEEHLFSLCVLSEIHKDLVLVFNDFSKAFNALPNCVIVDALISCGISGTLLDAVVDALVSFRICSYDARNFVDFNRGVKQGGTCSGLIFCVALISLSRELDHAQIERPILVGAIFVTGLLFADDLVLCALSLRDGKVLSTIVENWSVAHGLVLNKDKCRILCGYKSKSLWYKAVLTYRYLGVNLTYKDSQLTLSRSDSNSYFAHKVSPAVRVLNDPRVFKSVVMTFNSGLYPQALCHLNLLASATCPYDVVNNFKSKDKHWEILVSNFFRFERGVRVSIPRVTCELGLAAARFGPALLKSASDLFHYFSTLDSDCIAYRYFEAGSVATSALENAARLHQQLALSCVKLDSNSWLFIPKKERNLVARVFLSVRASSLASHKSDILSLIHSKEFSKLRKYCCDLLA